MATIRLETRLKRSEQFITATVDDALVMMSLDRGAYYALDDIGSMVWERLEETTTAAALCDDMVARFDVSRAQCEEDVLAFLQELANEGMVEIADGDAG